MNNPLRIPTELSSFLRTLACCAAFGVTSSAYAVCTPTTTEACLSNQPIQSTSIVKPNVMFVLDNSGSMVWDIMSQDSALSDNVNTGKYCRENYQYNTVYYNPNFNYTAAVPKNSLNVSMGTQSFTAAKINPFSSATTRNLSTVFCAEGGMAGTCGTGAATTTTNQQPAFYYKYTGAGSPGTTCSANANYTKVPVTATSCAISGDVTACPTGADERENFANWYSYYRTRILMMKSGMSTAFSTIDDNIRVGFHTINNPGSGNSSGRSLNIDDFAATQKNNWYNALWSISPSGGTPLQNALSRVGNYYSNSGTRTGLSTLVDPVQYSCQKNFTILSTDGYWNSNTTTVGNRDKTVPASMPVEANSSAYVPTDTGLTENAQFPRPYYEGATASSNSLADVAMYYWIRDLRTSGGVAANNVPTTVSDPAYWQHMTTYTVGLGVDGERSFPTDLAALTSGALEWPVPVADTKSAVDDLWHAAINGRGQYYRATDPASLSNSLNAALLAVTDVPAFPVGPSSSTNDLKSPDQNDYTTYISTYRTINWSGDVQKYALDRTTGMKTGLALWSASKQLDTKVNPGLTSSVNATAYTTRIIVTRNDLGNAVDFAYTAAPDTTTLSASQLAALCYKVSPGTGPCVAGDASLINYLRGDATYEGVYGVGSSRFRDRHDASELTYFKRDLIGSIVNAQPAYVAAEHMIYQDPGYGAFKTASKTRTPALYVGANDGMLHAFNAATGNELWAYVPSFVIPTATDEDGKEKGLRALSYQNSGAPAFKHHFYLDGPLEVGAVDFNRTGGPNPIVSSEPTLSNGIWKSILVGGLGKGGKGYYALDVTSPATTSAQAKASVLWEFPSATDSSHDVVRSGGLMGYSFGRPLIAKTYSYGWVVMLPSGYNNADGYGYVFVLNAKTGALLETLKTPIGAPGMAHITALGKSMNPYVMQAYSGDLNGNLWRFDFGLTPLTPRISQIFSSSSATPIATEVNVSIDGNNGDRWIFFGTGRYLDVPDRTVAAGYQQYLVALRDGKLNGPRTAILPEVLAPVALSALTTVINLMDGVASAPSGWKYALTTPPSEPPVATDPVIGERNSLPPVADLRTVIFVTLAPTTDPCSPGVNGNAYALDYSSGKSRLMDGTNLKPYFHSATGISSATIQMGGKTAGSSGNPQVVICSNDGTCVTRNLDPSKLFSGTRHVGWRELLNEY